MKRHSIFPIVFGILLLASCDLSPPSPRVAFITPTLTESRNQFAVDLYGQLRLHPGNFFFAPYSVSTALGMVYAGANANTATEIAKTLHLNDLAPDNEGNLQTIYLRDVAAQPAFGDGEPDGSKFETANALWGAKHYNFNAAYIRTVKYDFGGDLRRVNFGNAEAASEKINNWVATRTDGKIPTLVYPSMMNSFTRLVLTNAVYFKAGWSQPFDVGQTRKALFHTALGQDVQADTMDMTSELGYAADDGVQILTLDYRYGDTSMVVVLPKAKDGLQAVEAGLSLQEINALLANMQYPLVHVAIPKFSADSMFDLVPALKALGLNQLFDPIRCDLTGIATDQNGPLYVNVVINKAYLDVDEVGTEAAATTGLAVAAASGAAVQVGPPPVPIPFIANHPFLYFIRDNLSGEILFMGRVEDPTN